MPEVELVDGPERYRVAGQTFEQGDCADVSDGLAEYLCSKPWFVVTEPNPTCAGNGGDCGRTVDEPGGFCWQHSED